MSASLPRAEHPCPCDNCDEYAMTHDEYCIKCLHHNCEHGSPKCPGPLKVTHCPQCGGEREQRVLDRCDGLCAGCHHRQDPGLAIPLYTPQTRLAHF